MKKWMSVIVLLGMVGISHSQELNPQYRLWKTSMTYGSEANVILATAPIMLHGVNIDSPTYSAGFGDIEFYQSTTSNKTAFVSTKAYAVTDASNGAFPPDHIYDVPISSFTLYRKSGAGRVQILYDFIKPPQGNVDKR